MRLPKDSAVFEALGNTDESSSYLGFVLLFAYHCLLGRVLKEMTSSDDFRAAIAEVCRAQKAGMILTRASKIQSGLLDAGALIATPRASTTVTSKLGMDVEICIRSCDHHRANAVADAAHTFSEGTC